MEIIDPHFHYWDVTPSSSSGHRSDFLGDAAKRFPTYLPTHYAADTKSLRQFKLRKAVFLEAISDYPYAEATWAIKMSQEPEIKNVEHGIVPYAQLEIEDTENLLQIYSQYPSIKGIRQILNHHPKNPSLTWPKVHEDYLHNPTWLKNYSLLAKYNFTFDFQLNPHQMKQAAEVISKNPKINVIIDHLGTLYLGSTKSEEEENLSVWRKGLKLLSSHKNVYIKLSMLEFTVPGWIKDSSKRKLITDIVREVIRLFGADRCMFASNWPVDARPNVTLPDLYDAFEEIASIFTEKEKHDLFYGTADRVYRLHRSSSL
jgi:predicted TIM-barrel fold metal-dependent hydrolase